MNRERESQVLFIIRVKGELKRVYINGCRYNERLNTETGGSKTSHIHWVVWEDQGPRQNIVVYNCCCLL
jgi:hypothetical protein